MNKTVLEVNGLGKQYRFYAAPRQRLLSLLGFDIKPAKVHWALKDVGFRLQQGQCLGLVGDNGAGKSTLLKLLAGTLQASEGSIKCTGRVTAILELGAGFHPEFTGRQNLMYAASLIGLQPSDMAHLESEIIAFAELEEAIDRPVKGYSSGMVVRLAFALVTAVQPEVLIIDEALAVGDQHFQKKCLERIETFRKSGCTILFCSHSLYHVRQLCDQVLWLDKGQVNGLGSTEQILSRYEDHVRLRDAADISGEQAANVVKAVPDKPAGLITAIVMGLDDNQCLAAQDLVVQVDVFSPSAEMPSVGVMLEQYKGTGITSVATHAEGVDLNIKNQQQGMTVWTVTLTFPSLPLHSGRYSLSFYLFDAKGVLIYDEWKDHIQFQWVSPSLTPGLVRLPHHWS